MILDCTLRDGGYYTNWNFSKEFVSSYIEAINVSIVNYVEIGYLSENFQEGNGIFYYCDNNIIQYFRRKIRNSKKIGLMINLKECDPEGFSKSSGMIKKINSVDFVRIACDPKETEKVKEIIKIIKKIKSVEVFINYMYLHKYIEDEEQIDNLAKAADKSSGVCFVDSYGCVLPRQLESIYNKFKNKFKGLIGFHGHDNLGLAAGNSLRAIELGFDVIDSTFTGMGRGAGNMRTEDLLLLSSDENSFSPEIVGYVSELNKLKRELGWGSNYAYASAAAKMIPQKDVMEWLSFNRLSLSEVINAISSENSFAKNKSKLFNGVKYNNPIVIGGGDTFKNTIEWLEYINEKNQWIFISYKNLNCFINHINKGDYKKSTEVFFCGSKDEFENRIIFSPKVKVTYIEPIRLELTEDRLDVLKNNKANRALAYYRENINFPISPLYTTISLIEQNAAECVILLGFDGYIQESSLSLEAECVFYSSKLFLVSPFKTMYDIKVDGKYFEYL